MNTLNTILILAMTAGAAAQNEAEVRPEVRSTVRGVDLDRLDSLLRAIVRDERVDYLRVRDEMWNDLVAVLDETSTVEPKTLSRDDRLAFYLNLYNATMIRAVCERFVSGWTPAVDEFGVFDDPLVDLAGERVSLNHLEHAIIRERFDEPRIHVALVCGSASCPPLLPRAWRGRDLEETLEDRMKAFVNDARRNDVVSSERVELSKIFEWFKVDFGGSDDALRGYVDRYTENDVSAAEIEFREYDWSLNIAAPEAGRWMAIVDGPIEVRVDGRDEPVELRNGEVVQVTGSTESDRTVCLPFDRGSVTLDAVRLEPWRTAR